MELRVAVNKLNEFKNIELYFNCSYFTSGKVKLDDKDREAIDTIIRELIIKNKMVDLMSEELMNLAEQNSDEIKEYFYKQADYYYLKHKDTDFNFFEEGDK